MPYQAVSYADDTTLFNSSKHLNIVPYKLNLNGSMTIIRFTVNARKTEDIIFSLMSLMTLLNPTSKEPTVN